MSVRAQKALQSMLAELAESPLDLNNLPSSAADPLGRNGKRVADRKVVFDGLTVYGRPVPNILLQVRLSKQGTEWTSGGRVEALGWFDHLPPNEWSKPPYKATPQIVLAVRKAHLEDPPDKASQRELIGTLRHELRHFIQYILSEVPYHACGIIPHMRRGGPPSAARDARTLPGRMTLLPGEPRYTTSDIEFQPMVAKRAEEAADTVRRGSSSPTEAVEVATRDPYIKLLAEHDPEKWKAAVRIISSEVDKVPRLPDLTPTGEKPSPIPYPRPTLSVRDMERSPTKNFRGAYLRGKNFGFSKAFDGADFTGADLRETDLEFVSLAGANLTNANLSHASLLAANLKGANLTNAVLTDTFLGAALFEDANLSGAYLNRASLCGTPFLKTNLRGANLTGANLTKAKLSDVDLTGANLTRANLTGAELSGTALEGAILKDTIMPDGTVYRGNPLRRARALLNNPRRTLRRDAIRFEGAAFSPDGFVMQYIALFDPAILGPLYNTHAGVPLEYVSRQAQFVLGGAWLYYPTEAAFDNPQAPATVEYIAAGEGFGPDIIQAVADKAGHPLKLSRRAWEASERLFARFGGTVYPSENPVPYRDERFGSDWALRLQPGMQAIYSSASWGYNNRQEGSAALPRYLEAADPQAQLRQDEDAVRGKLLQKPLPLPPPEPRARH